MLFRKKIKILQENLENRRIIFFVWPRQVWKTTIMKEIFKSLDTNKKLFLNLEIIDYHRFFQSFESIKELLYKNVFDSSRFYLFLDEFHKVKDISYILKSLYDEFENIKIIASGSNNIEINKKITDSFAWRKRVLYAFPLDFEEFIVWNEKIDLEEAKIFIKNPLNKAKINFYLEQYMIYWWYPEVTLAKTKQEKKQIFEDIFSSWFNKDIVPEVKNNYKFNDFLKQLAFRNWNLLNLNEISTQIWISQPTAEYYFHLLEESLLINVLRPFFSNKLKEIVKMPKFYFTSIGFRNFLVNKFEFSENKKWILFENFVFCEFLFMWFLSKNIKYWRQKSGKKEVDFVLEDIFKAIEVKYREKINSKDKSSLKFFKKSYTDFEDIALNKWNYYDVFSKLWGFLGKG